MRRKLLFLCVAVCLLWLGCFSAFAEEFDPRKTGSISVTLTEKKENKPIVGAELCVYHVATAHMNANGNWDYTYTATFEAPEIRMDDPSLATALDAYVSKHDVPFVKIATDENGTAICRDLALGLYFIRQTGAAEGFAPCTPFVVTVPVSSADGFVYDVNASPKTEVMKLASVTIKKVWNTDDSTEATDSVTVQLLQNGNVVKTATLNAQNDWQVTYVEMPESDAYSVKEVNVPKGFTATYTQNGYVFTVTNTSALVQTGQLTWPIPVLAISGMLLIALGIVLLQKKRKANA